MRMEWNGETIIGRCSVWWVDPGFVKHHHDHDRLEEYVVFSNVHHTETERAIRAICRSVVSPNHGGYTYDHVVIPTLSAQRIAPRYVWEVEVAPIYDAVMRLLAEDADTCHYIRVPTESPYHEPKSIYTVE